MTENIIDWNGENDCCQGDVLLFRIPDSITINTSNEISPINNKLILAEGEVTGHHHAIWFAPTMFRVSEGDGGSIDTAAMIANVKTKGKVGTARLYRDSKVISDLVRIGELTTDRLAIGILVIEGAPMVLRHDEHDAIRIPIGRFYVGGQMEWDAGEARRVAD